MYQRPTNLDYPILSDDAHKFIAQLTFFPKILWSPYFRISVGMRSEDQFCVYVQDFFVIPEIVKSGNYVPEKELLDKLTKKYIHENLSYRYVVFQDENSIQIVRSLESKIKCGESSFGTPFLNGVE